MEYINSTYFITYLLGKNIFFNLNTLLQKNTINVQ